MCLTDSVKTITLMCDYCSVDLHAHFLPWHHREASRQLNCVHCAGHATGTTCPEAFPFSFLHRRASPGMNTTKLFVGQVPGSCDQSYLHELFGQYGEVAEVYILRAKVWLLWALPNPPSITRISVLIPSIVA